MLFGKVMLSKAPRVPGRQRKSRESQAEGAGGGIGVRSTVRKSFAVPLLEKFQVSAVQGFPGGQADPDGDKDISTWELHNLAKQVSMSVSDLMAIKRIFDSFDEDHSGRLDIHEFEVVVRKILEYQLQDPKAAGERAKAASEWHWFDSDANQAGALDFKDFVKWYSSNGFKEDLLLTPEEVALRTLTKRFSLNASTVDRIKHAFDMYDADRSGRIDIAEFECVLNRLMTKALTVQGEEKLPRSRVQYFWSEIDTDGDGNVSFDEFLGWWVKYFKTQDKASGCSEGLDVLVNFYANVRTVRAYDPPAYDVPEEDPGPSCVDDE